MSVKTVGDLWVGFFSICATLVAGPVVLLCLGAPEAWALSVAWGMVIVPLYGAPPLTFWHAFFFLTLAQLLRGQRPRSPNATGWSGFGDYVAGTLLRSAFLLLVAWWVRP